MQVEGTSDPYKMPVAAFMTEMQLQGAFFSKVIRYSQALALQIQQTSACNALHPAEQRCCRWLLMTRDRVGSDELKLTHDFLAIPRFRWRRCRSGVHRESIRSQRSDTSSDPVRPSKLLSEHGGATFYASSLHIERISLR